MRASTYIYIYMYLYVCVLCMYMHPYTSVGARGKRGGPGIAGWDILGGWEKKLGISRFRWPSENWGCINMCGICVRWSNGRKRGPLVLSILREITYFAGLFVLLFFRPLAVLLHRPFFYLFLSTFSLSPSLSLSLSFSSSWCVCLPFRISSIIS